MPPRILFLFFSVRNGIYNQKFEDQLEFFLFLGQEDDRIVSIQLTKRKVWCIIWQETTNEEVLMSYFIFYFQDKNAL